MVAELRPRILYDNANRDIGAGSSRQRLVHEVAYGGLISASVRRFTPRMRAMELQNRENPQDVRRKPSEPASKRRSGRKP